ALQDREDDKKIGLKSTAIFFGKKIKLFVKKFYLISFLLLLFSVNNISNFNIFIFLIVALWALIYIFKSLKKVNVKFPARADWFFRANNYYGLLIFLAIIAG
ncbi:MAG: UbiA family prenyltransferase, partial [Pirellulaceae bacterium]